MNGEAKDGNYGEDFKNNHNFDLPVNGSPNNNKTNNEENAAANNNNNNNRSNREENYALRSLIQSKYVGAIIGVQGLTIKSIREQTETRISIDTAGGPQAQERILAVSGSVTNVSKAYGVVCSKMEQQDQRSDKETNESNNNTQQNKIFLYILVPQQQTGALIGKEGIKIKSIRELSGAHVSVAQQALQNSTERAVKVTGSPEAISIAIDAIIRCLLENPARGHVVPYSGEVYMYGPPGPPNDPYYGGNNSNNRGGPRGNMPPMYPPNNQYMRYPVIESSATVTIPESLVGVIIGKRGIKINQLRQQNGVRINIINPQPGSSDHQVVLIGTPEGCRNAAMHIKSRIDRELAHLSQYSK